MKQRCEEPGCWHPATHEVIGITSQGNRPGGQFCEPHADEQAARRVEEGLNGMWSPYPLNATEETP